MLPGRTIYASQQPGITNFKLHTINRTSAHVEGPMNMPSLVVTTDSTTLTRGQTYTVTLTHSKDPVYFPNARNNIRIWIDYNKNFSWLDAGETVISADLQAAGTYTATFTVPANAPLGATRLRATAKMSADAGHTLPTPCDEPADPLDYHGEIEDYKVIIAAPTSVGEAGSAAVTGIYPNPTAKNITVALGAILHEPIRIELYNLAGKMVAPLLDRKDQNTTSYSFDLNAHALPNGLYFMKVSLGNSVSLHKVVKTN
jgi:hypothetical protein